MVWYPGQLCDEARAKATTGTTAWKLGTFRDCSRSGARPSKTSAAIAREIVSNLRAPVIKQYVRVSTGRTQTVLVGTFRYLRPKGQGS